MEHNKENKDVYLYCPQELPSFRMVDKTFRERVQLSLGARTSPFKAEESPSDIFWVLSECLEHVFECTDDRRGPGFDGDYSHCRGH